VRHLLSVLRNQEKSKLGSEKNMIFCSFQIKTQQQKSEANKRSETKILKQIDAKKVFGNEK
jgi:hypothetical protein